MDCRWTGLSECEAVSVKGDEAEGLTIAFWNINHAEEDEMREARKSVVGRLEVWKCILTE